MKPGSGSAKNIVFFVDTSGEPDVNKCVVVTTLVAEVSCIESLGLKLQSHRFINRCDRSLHFAELGRKTSCGGAAHLALDFLRTLLRDPLFQVRCQSLVVDCSSFEMHHYGNKRSVAINRLIRTNVNACLARYFDPGDQINLKLYVDGHETEKQSAETFNYLSWALSVRRSPWHPTILTARVHGVPRSPLEPVGPRRHLQDLVAICDLVAGALRFGVEKCASKSIKAELSGLVYREMKEMTCIPPHERCVSADRYFPPRNFEPVVPYIEPASRCG